MGIKVILLSVLGTFLILSVGIMAQDGLSKYERIVNLEQRTGLLEVQVKTLKEQLLELKGKIKD